MTAGRSGRGCSRSRSTSLIPGAASRFQANESARLEGFAPRDARPPLSAKHGVARREISSGALLSTGGCPSHPRGLNDLVWVGQAPNVAAKLSTIREAPYTTYITKAVYDRMRDEVKLSNGENMWEPRTWVALPEGKHDLYRSKFLWKP